MRWFNYLSQRSVSYKRICCPCLSCIDFSFLLFLSQRQRNFPDRKFRACLASTTCQAYPLSDLQRVYIQRYKTELLFHVIRWSISSRYVQCRLCARGCFGGNTRETKRDNRSLYARAKNVLTSLDSRRDNGKGEQETIKQSPNTFMILPRGQCTERYSSPHTTTIPPFFSYLFSLLPAFSSRDLRRNIFAPFSMRALLAWSRFPEPIFD